MNTLGSTMKTRHQHDPKESVRQPWEGNQKPQPTGFGRQSAKSKSRMKARRKNDGNKRQKLTQNAQKECPLLFAIISDSKTTKTVLFDLATWLSKSKPNFENGTMLLFKKLAHNKLRETKSSNRCSWKMFQMADSQ
jgi:hypothetical protein